MVPYDTVEEYTRKQEGYVEHVRIRRTDDEQYPSGWITRSTTERPTARRSSDMTTLTSGRKDTNDTQQTL